jgi:hypothetical protein
MGRKTKNVYYSLCTTKKIIFILFLCLLTTTIYAQSKSDKKYWRSVCKRLDGTCWIEIIEENILEKDKLNTSISLDTFSTSFEYNAKEQILYMFYAKLKSGKYIPLNHDTEDLVCFTANQTTLIGRIKLYGLMDEVGGFYEITKKDATTIEILYYLSEADKGKNRRIKYRLLK